MVDTGADVTIISQESWDPHWPLQKVTSLLRLEHYSKVKQSVRQIKCVRPEGTIGRLEPHAADISMDLWGRDRVQPMGSPD